MREAMMLGITIEAPRRVGVAFGDVVEIGKQPEGEEARAELEPDDTSCPDLLKHSPRLDALLLRGGAGTTACWGAGRADSSSYHGLLAARTGP